MYTHYCLHICALIWFKSRIWIILQSPWSGCRHKSWKPSQSHRHFDGVDHPHGSWFALHFCAEVQMDLSFTNHLDQLIDRLKAVAWRPPRVRVREVGFLWFSDRGFTKIALLIGDWGGYFLAYWGLLSRLSMIADSYQPVWWGYSYFIAISWLNSGDWPGLVCGSEVFEKGQSTCCLTDRNQSNSTIF